MGAKNGKFYYLMLLADGYAVLDEPNNRGIVGSATFDELIEYLQVCGAHREDIEFVEVDEDDFNDKKKVEILNALPLSAIK